jgi:hypothetical protein
MYLSDGKKIERSFRVCFKTCKYDEGECMCTFSRVRMYRFD